VCIFVGVCIAMKHLAGTYTSYQNTLSSKRPSVLSLLPLRLKIFQSITVRSTKWMVWFVCCYCFSLLLSW